MGDLKKLASPFSAEVEKAWEEQGEQLEVIIALLRGNNKKSSEKIMELVKIRKLKESQALNDCLWRGKWSRQKNISIYISLTATLFTFAAFYLNVIKLNEDSAFYQGAANFLRMLGL